MFIGAKISDVIIVLCTVVPILLLAIVAFIIALVKKIKVMRQYKGDPLAKDKNKETKNQFLMAYGEENILHVTMEMSRVTVEVKDIEKVNPEKLKSLGANSVYLVGNQVKCSYQEPDKVYQILMEEINGKEEK